MVSGPVERHRRRAPPCRRGWSVGRRGRSAPSRRRGRRRRRARSKVVAVVERLGVEATCGRRARPTFVLDRPVARRRPRRSGPTCDGAPEADVDVGRARLQRVERPGVLVRPCSSRSRSGHSHTGRIPTSRRTSRGTRQCGRPGSRRPGRPARAAAGRARRSRRSAMRDAPVSRATILPVDVGAPPALAATAGGPAGCCAPNAPRAPEPVGVPAPQVVVHRQQVRSSRCWSER